MTAIHILLQSGNVTIGSAVNQIVEQVGVPAMQILFAVGGFSLVISMLMFPAAYLIEYMLHPTSWGRSAALTEAINHIKKPNRLHPSPIPGNIHLFACCGACQ
jgi:hypothetical protein